MRYLLALLLFFAGSASAVQTVAPIGATPTYMCWASGVVGASSPQAALVNWQAFRAQTTTGTITWPTVNYTPGVQSDVYGGGCYDSTGTYWIQARILIPATVSCPVPTSGSPYTFNPATGLCERPDVVCPAAGTKKSSGWYDIGTVSTANNGAPPLVACDASCEVNYTGSSVSRKAIIVGITHYYAQGSYVHTGFNCTTSTGSGASLTAVPGSSCAAGQSFVSMGGVDKCLNSATGTPASTDSVSAVAAAATLAAQAAADKAAADAAAMQSAVAAAKTAAAAAGADASGVLAAGVQAAANVAAQQQNPAPDPCKGSTSVSCMTTGDVPAAEDIQTKTIDFGTFTFNTYTFSGNAACPAPRTYSVMGGAHTYSFQPFCDFLNVFKYIALAVAMFIAGMIIIGQRSTDTGG